MNRAPFGLVAAMWGILIGSPPCLAGQASPVVALDDPLLPLFEHLVDRGTIRDPTPFIRPFRQAEALDALHRARPAGDSALVARLIAAWSPPDTSGYWTLVGRVGGDAFSQPRRDPLRPEGPGGVRVLSSIEARAVLGPILLATRPTVEQRVAIDPDWPGARVNASATCCRWHFPEAYVAYQQGPVRVHLGQLSRNWGPVGVAGVAMSEVAYARDDIALEVLSRDLHLISTVGFLRDTTREDGTPIRRYQVASRVGLRLSEHWRVGGWQTAVLEGPSREVEGPFRNPMVLLPLVNQFGSGDRDNNVMVGGQVEWRSNRGLAIQAEAALDDLIQRDREDFPDRWAATLRVSGPGPQRTSWTLLYTRATALAFRATDPNESFTERGIGLGRGWADGELVTLRLARPIGTGWLAALALTGFQRGESRLHLPIDREAALSRFPTGTPERTARAAVGFSGRSGPLEVAGDVGVNHVRNVGHQSGVRRTTIEGRVTALLRLGTRGTLQ